MSLGVAERATAPAQSDAASLRRALERRAELARRADKWLDRLMEDVVDRDAFQRALSYVHAKQYAEAEHERHLNGLCAYPMCPNPPAAPYRAQRRFVVSTRNRSITETEGNADEAFCGGRCRARGGWVRSTLGTEAAWIRGRVEPLTLLEDLEARGEVRWGGRRGDVLERVAAEPAAAAAATTAPAASTPPPDLIANLSIYERPTPTTKPLPPSLGGGGDAARPAPAPAPAHAPAPAPLPLPRSAAAPTPPRRAAGASSMISSSSTKLASTLLAAAKALPPGVQDAADSDDESSASEEDWAKEMGWGQGRDVDALFDEARAAREMLEGGDK
ncbi:hypothetical protein VHUM_02918 [Vanrija humicola]|uniref:RNA polymerase II subunit B1 CTD phosphatase RPAP2 homolog n=1 Tax=Vanrija humicola TaxID=5417 RepID=A0A7D8UYX5_VANHU|nr:hypothetical protein VHUM_02918 [Vanrija humicola]